MFTFANILPDGRMVLIQADIALNNQDRFKMVFEGSTTGNHKSELEVDEKYATSTISYSYRHRLGSSDIDARITMNNGEFVEGTFSGEVSSGGESLGQTEGTFRARIQ